MRHYFISKNLIVFKKLSPIYILLTQSVCLCSILAVLPVYIQTRSQHIMMKVVPTMHKNFQILKPKKKGPLVLSR
jgi:hypothetical protein